MWRREEQGRKRRGREQKEKKKKKKKNERLKTLKTHLIKVMDVALSLELPEGRILLQGPAVELLVRRDDVDSGLFCLL